MTIVFVTGNKDKVREAAVILGMELEHVALELEEIQSLNILEIVEHKTKQAFEQVLRPVITEDTELIFTAWGGLPGPFIKFFEKAIGYAGLCSMLQEDREALSRTVIGYYDGKIFQSFMGETKGTIAREPRGQGFGWDVIFIPDTDVRTYGEMTMAEKHSISARSKALNAAKTMFLSGN